MEARLAELAALVEKGAISQAECEKARAAVLAAPIQVQAAHTEQGDASTALAEHLKEESLLRREPWRAHLRHFAGINATLAAAQVEHVRQTFLDAAKNALLSEEDVMAGTYLLYGDAHATKIFAQILLQRQGLERVRHHNWFVAQHLGEQWLATYGPRVDALVWPLFPPVPEFSALNSALVQNAGVSGGDAPTQRRPKCFRAPRNDGPQGGGTLPVFLAPDGAPYVDTGVVETAFANAAGETAALRAQISTLQAAVKRLSAGTGRNGTGRGSAGRGGQGSAAVPGPWTNGQGRGWSANGRGRGGGVRGGEEPPKNE